MVPPLIKPEKTKATSLRLRLWAEKRTAEESSRVDQLTIHEITMLVWRMSTRPESDTRIRIIRCQKEGLCRRPVLVGVDAWIILNSSTELAACNFRGVQTVDQLHHDRRRSGFYFFRSPEITCKSYSNINISTPSPINHHHHHTNTVTCQYPPFLGCSPSVLLP